MNVGKYILFAFLFIGGTMLAANSSRVRQNFEFDWRIPLGEVPQAAAPTSPDGDWRLAADGKPARLDLLPDHTRQFADGEEIAQIEIRPVDAKGVLVPNHDRVCSVEVASAGRLLAVDNGNPDDLTLLTAQSRKLHHDRALTTVESRRRSGPITVTAPGLPGAGSKLQEKKRSSNHVRLKTAVHSARLQQMALRRELRQLFKEGVCGVRLQRMVLSRCKHIAYWNRPYQYNGIGDCYGYCRQVWNAILADGKEHTEDYYPHKYDKKRWIDINGGIPVNTFPDTNWVYFSNPKLLVPGDLLATDQGHFWGPKWHGGIYAGHGENWDCSTHNGLNGAYKRPLFSGFHYYYKPLHELLLANSSTPITSHGVKYPTSY